MTAAPSPGVDLARLSPQALIEYLRRRGVPLPRDPHVEVLAGGVSGTVLAVRGQGQQLVVKQALARLAVPGEWRADPRRTRTEAEALHRLHTLTPGATAEFVDLDPAAYVLTMTCAPEAWTTWKAQLLDTTGTHSQRAAATSLATTLGGILAEWHTGTAGSAQDFHDHETFRALRSDPFYRALARIHPDLGARLSALADGLDAAQICLVHGDFSPKNVLTPPGAGDALRPCWVVDHEVAVAGDPVFDLAFMLCHLTCKSVAGGRTWLQDAARAFCAAYANGGGLPIDPSALAGHTAALMLARVDGVSRVGYLDPAEQQTVRAAAQAVLADPTATVDDLWRHTGRPMPGERP